MTGAKKGGAFKVTALVGVLDENGGARQLFAGDIVPEGTKQESIDHLLDLGYIVEGDVPAEDKEPAKKAASKSDSK